MSTSPQRIALITGITGQDGAYLAALLLKKNYVVVGLVRSYTQSKVQNLAYLGILHQVKLEGCDLNDITQIIKLFQKYQPDEVYNLAAQSSVSLSFNQPIGTLQYNVLSVVNLMESIKLLGMKDKVCFYQASSSEMYGKVLHLPITENTAFHPLSPYAISKATAHWLTVNYRESYGLRASCGILFNHESYLRAEGFFIKKVVRESLLIRNGSKDELRVGNIDIKRDFGYAKKYVEAMWLMQQQEKPRDYLICSGKSVSLRAVIEYVFAQLNIPMERLIVDKDLYRPTDIEDIYGDNSCAKQELSWEYDMDFFEVLNLLIEEEERAKVALHAIQD